MTNCLTLTACALVLAAAPVAGAQVILFEDFEGDATPADSLFNADGFGGSDGDVDFVRSIDATGGVGGSAGYSLAATNSDPFSGTFIFAGAQSLRNLSLAGFDPADLVLTADIAATNTADGSALPTVRLALVEDGTSNSFFFQPGGPDAADVFSQFGGTLDTATVEGDGVLKDADYSIFVQYSFGNDLGAGVTNTLLFDNVSLSVVPEPASLGLLGFAGLGLVRRRK